MAVRVELALLIAMAAVSNSASPQEPPESDQDLTAIPEADAAHKRSPELTSVEIVYEPDDQEHLHASEGRSKQARKCPIVNNKPRCRPVRPSYGSPIGRPGKQDQDVEPVLQNAHLLKDAPTQT